MRATAPLDKQPFLDAERAEQERNATFAVQLIDLLAEKFDTRLGTWHEAQPVRQVANTCQIIEAFHAVSAQVTAPLSQAALEWLCELPNLDDPGDDEARAVRLYPSRFKTLAQFDHLAEDHRALAEFRELCEYVQPADGILHDAPSVLRPELATIIWLDTLWYMAQHEWDVGVEQRRQRRATRTIETLYSSWAERKGAPPSEDGARRRSSRNGASEKQIALKRPGDASYALDLLLRNGRLAPGDPAVRAGKTRLMQVLREHRRGDWTYYDPGYCGIQLCLHFGTDPQVRRAVAELIGELREAFPYTNTPEQVLSLAALSLRLMGAFYGPELGVQMMQYHWSYRKDKERLQRESEHSQKDLELSKILRRTFQITLGEDPELLSSRRSENQVVRVRFGFDSPAVDDRGTPAHAESSELRLILKRGSLESLDRAIKSYNALQPILRSYFAAHNGAPTPSESKTDPAWYLVMSDLSGMEPLHDLIERNDRTPLQDAERRALEQAVNIVGGALQALHHDARPASGLTNQLERLYLLRMTESLDVVCDEHFPSLRSFVDEGFSVDDVPYKRLSYYLAEVHKLETFLRPPMLGKTHGDTHTRNLMLDSQIQRVKFIDVEFLSDHQDYVTDYALLLEDLAFYRLLPGNDTRQRVRADELVSTLASHGGGKTNVVQYPPFPVRSEAALFMQQALLKRLAAFANERDDKFWQPRLWLALARSLFMLLERQSRSGRLRAQPPERGLNLTLVIYAEAIRLLDEIVNHVGKRELPALPFTGTRQVTRQQDPRALAQQVIQLLQELPGVRLRRHPEVSPWILFSLADRPEPFAEFHNATKQGDMELLLYAPPHALEDPEHLIATRTQDKKGVVVPKARLTNLGALRALIFATYRWSMDNHPEF